MYIIYIVIISELNIKMCLIITKLILRFKYLNGHKM